MQHIGDETLEYSTDINKEMATNKGDACRRVLGNTVSRIEFHLKETGGNMISRF